MLLLISESKLSPLWNIILDSNKQLLVNEKYLASVGTEGKRFHFSPPEHTVELQWLEH